MAEKSINISLSPEIIEPVGGNLSSYVGNPSAPNSGQNKHPDSRRASTGSDRNGGNTRRNSIGKPTFPNNRQNILPHHIRASTGSFHDVVNSRRNSSGIPSSPNSGESVTPNYLRASTGSCHDFCKYGIKHEVEVKPRRPFPKRVITLPSDRQNPTESGVPVERRTTELLKPMPSPVSKSLSSISPSFLKHEVSSPLKKIEVSSRKASSNEKKIARNDKKPNVSGKRTPVKPKTMTVMSSSSPDTSGVLNGRRKSEIKIGTSKAAVKKVLASPAASLSPKPSINRVVSLNVKKYRSLKLSSPLKDQNRIRKGEPKQPNSEVVSALKFSSLPKSPALSFHEEEAQEEFEYTESNSDQNRIRKAELKQPKSEKVPEKTLHVVKVETENKALESTQNGSGIPSPPSPLLSSPKFSSLPKSPVLSFHEEEAQEEFEYTEPNGDQNSIRKSEPEQLKIEKVPEKTLHVVEVETENKFLESTPEVLDIHSPPSSSPSLSSPKFSSLSKSPTLSFREEESQEESEYTDSDADESDDSISESSEAINLQQQVEISDGNRNREPRKAGVAVSEDVDCTPMKLKFRRGKVVDLQSENSGPRRLRFRRGRVLGENQDSRADIQRRRFKKRGADDDTNGTDADSGKVVLRHQDVQGKKDAQGLFNNVIEETASKLVESRKSKVKALVGAFETVISLQESKPSTQTVT